MFNIAVPAWELVVRGCVVYTFLLILLRLTGKRQIGQLAPFDLVLLLVLSNAVQNSMNAGDNSLVGGLISAATLVAINYGIGYATFKNKTLETLIEGRPEIIIHNGRVFDDVMKKAKLTHHELTAALRSAGCTCAEEVHSAVLEKQRFDQRRPEGGLPCRRWTGVNRTGPFLPVRRGRFGSCWRRVSPHDDSRG